MKDGIVTGIYKEDNYYGEKAEGVNYHVTDTGREADIDCKGRYIIPGLVDIHTHGCVGYDFSEASREALENMTSYYYDNGITHVLATTMTNAKATLLASVGAISEYIKYQGLGCSKECIKAQMAGEKAERNNIVQCDKHAIIEGIYMEGPFFGAARKGAHDEKYLMPLDEQYLMDFDNESSCNTRVVAFDPCLKGAGEFVERNGKKYVLSIAHTDCDYETAYNIMKKGAMHVTHLYNAMNGFDKRSPGVVGAFFDEPGCYGEIICDGIHVHPSVLRAMFHLCPDRMVAISDSMSATGLADGIYSLGGQTVYVKDYKAVLSDGTIAGSVTNLFNMMKKLIKYGVEPETAVAAVTINPAKSVQLDHLCGEIKTGRKADFLVLDEEYNIVMRA